MADRIGLAQTVGIALISVETTLTSDQLVHQDWMASRDVSVCDAKFRLDQESSCGFTVYFADSSRGARF